MLNRVLVANRGEIAVRVIRAARDLGIETVAVYSAADQGARHATLADRAVRIGPGPATASYLRPDSLLHVALATECDAVHPGYGFLSEDRGFARQVAEAGLTWIGPAADTIGRMGDKAAARATASAHDVPVVPGSAGVVDVDAVEEFGARHGYPLLLKARSGGGGKGMRVVTDADALRTEYLLARQEAGGAFGDDGLYVERYLPRVRHVEIQVLADTGGTVVSLGERDCSMQRRHQKMLEESPSPRLSAERREQMGEAAVRLARAVDYVSAGTVEFLVDAESGRFFFIEMNTRIQVEHPVTEELTGVDLVAWQLRIAAGESLDPGPVTPAGHAMEFRITAEDPDRDFAPTPGVLTTFEPPGGPGVRCDTHCFPGCSVPPYYDSLLAKLIVRGRDRDETLRRARRALAEFRIEGVPTTRDLHRRLLDQPELVAGTYTTDYLPAALPALAPTPVRT
jgi:acetyl-CoA carboxylase biotin carboxylase subunit